MSPSTSRVFQHLKTGDGGTVGEIARALGMPPKTARDCLLILRHEGLAEVISGPGELLAYAWTGVEPKQAEVPAPVKAARAMSEPEYTGGAITAQAIRNRTALEVAWAA